MRNASGLLRAGARPATAEVVAFIDANKDRVSASLRWGVEPICVVIQVAPSTHYAARKRTPSARARSDAEWKPIILDVWQKNRCVYGADKLWGAMQREGHEIGRDRVHRLMRELGIRGVGGRAKAPGTTTPANEWPADRLNRHFSAGAPNTRWVADITYVGVEKRWCYVAFVIDPFARMIVGWAAGHSLSKALPYAAPDRAFGFERFLAQRRTGGADGERTQTT